MCIRDRYSNLCIRSTSDIKMWSDVVFSSLNTPLSSSHHDITDNNMTSPNTSSVSLPLVQLQPKISLNNTNSSNVSSMNDITSSILMPVQNSVNNDNNSKKRSREEIEALAAAKGARGG